MTGPSRTSRWTTRRIDDQHGRVAIVTGANSGLGLETVRELARKGAHCILASRNLTKAKTAVADIRAELPGASVEVAELDLADLTSVRGFASAFCDANDRLDLLINNAGIMMVPQGITVDGFEKQFGTNHLGHFALAGLVLDPLMATEGSRVVTLSSLAHRSGAMNFDNLMYENGGYSPMGAYGRSKLANLLFTYELQRRLEAVDSSTIAVAAHPGIAGTGLADHLFANALLRPIKSLLVLATQSSADGARATLRAATDPALTGGEYLGPGGFQEQRGAPVVVRSSASSRRAGDAARLWAKSAELTGVSYKALATS